MIKNLKTNISSRSFIDTEKDRREYIKKLISVYEILYPVEENRLTNSERDFLAECIFLETQGKSMGSTAARKHLEEFFGIKKRSVYTLRRDLKKKGWLSQNDLGYHFPPGLDMTHFKLELIFKEHEGDDSR